ncbi:MAG: SUMF1/EgtB/PvdO family nonheme iron enzyme [Alphaproteobacteria bacterium]|nr:SUMF1/EgtB/PvdO family nonheme iron enzyme [Alphaproteobacteria bacterium]
MLMAHVEVIHDPLASGERRPTGERFINWEPVGKGGSSDVFKVFDAELSISLAIKILKQSHRGDRRYIESLRSEVLISRRLRHPNICPIHDLYEGDRGVGIVMDLIEGYDLKDWLRKNRGTLLDTMPGRLSLLSKLCAALTVAHSLITHRDLKPANIFLRKGDISQPVIMDFGLSTPDDRDSAYQLEGGTPKYMAPEQFLRLADIDQRADLYALGILAYELLTDGNIPACSLRDVHKTGVLPVFQPQDIIPPSTFCAAIPPELDRLILTLIEHDRNKRPGSAAEVGRVLEKVVLLDPFRSLSPDDRLATVAIAAGAYIVGEKGGSRAVDQPQKKIRLSAFQIATTPVINADYRRFMAATGYKGPGLIDHPLFGAASHPVVMVSWDDASAYARWAGGRLPTELEWEVAAKAGNAENVFPWGATPPQPTHANIDNLCACTTPVGSYRAGHSGQGLMDCCGNVWEWCSDAWDDALLKSLVADSLDPRSAAGGELRAIRGGSFDSPAMTGRNTFRHRVERQTLRADIGFRIVYGP